jgi:hypothetical protein
MPKIAKGNEPSFVAFLRKAAIHGTTRQQVRKL